MILENLNLELYIAKYLIFVTPLFLIYYIWKHDNKKLAIKESFMIGGGAVIGWILANIVKNILKIPRPVPATDVLFQNESLYSFPSGHTTFFFTLATIMFFYHRKISYLIFVLGAVVGYCRVDINVHFPVDIWGGAMLGIAVGILIQNSKSFYHDLFFNKIRHNTNSCHLKQVK